jgi:superoxide dismutase, Cu-Zn family
LRRYFFAALLGSLALLVVGGTALAQGAPRATADLEDADGNPVGTAEFVETPRGVEVSVEVEGGIEPGEKGIHIHETGSIEPDFEAAGDHFNPTDAQHGLENPEGPHAGDLENIVVAEDGTASYRTVNDRITLGEGENSILGGDGTALVIHAEPDDQVTDPSGESGDRVAAGVIEPAGIAGEVPATGGPDPLLAAGALAGAIAAGLLGLTLVLLRRGSPAGTSGRES